MDAPPSLPGDTTTLPAVDSKDSPQAAAAPAAAKAKPSQPPLSADRSRTLIKNAEAITAHRPLNPVEQADLDQAKKVVAQDTVKGLEQKAQDNGGQLDAGDTQALTKARAQAGETDTAARQSPNNSQAAGKPATPNGVNPSADPNSPAAPPGRGGGRPAVAASRRIPDSGTPGPAAPARPSRPPLSVEDSKKLIANVAKMPAPARQHPTVQADLAQAQRVVAESAQSPGGDPTQQSAPGKGASTRGEANVKASHSRGGPVDESGSIKSIEERRAENAELLARRPRRRSPFSDKLTVTVKGLHGEVLRKAALLSDLAHDDGTMPPANLNDYVRNDENDGEYRPGNAGVRPGLEDPLMTGVHELGHHIATHALKPEALQRIRDVARDTATWERIIKQDRKLKYWTDPEEVFCRAYAQLVALRSGDAEMLAELEKTLKDPKVRFTQWPPSEFARLQNAVEQELKNIGWL